MGAYSLQNILGGAADFLIAVTLEEAKKILEENVDLIICGIHFDESRMFDFLRIVKADSQTRDIPFLCFRDLDSELAPAVVQSLEISCRALGAEAFIDIYEQKSKHGIENADERFREVIFENLKHLKN